MNINIKEDLKNNKMEFTIKLDKRTMARQERITLGLIKVKAIVDQKYKCPNTHVLGECLNAHLKMDNQVDDQLEKTYIFNLIPKQTKQAGTKKKLASKNTRTEKVKNNG